MKKKLKIIGALEGRAGFGPTQISDAIKQGSTALAHNSEFTGRPETNIYANRDTVVKIRRDLKLTAAQADPWLGKVLERERQLGVYHPEKTWFYIYIERDGTIDLSEEVLIGNITPRLRPLHKLLEVRPDTESARRVLLRQMTSMFEMYLQTAERCQLKLDEGLSNFALDANDRLFYVDDETYPWDKFISFSVMLGVMIRKLEWLDRDFARTLATELGQQIDHIFGDLNYRASIAYQLRSAFMPAGKKRDIANLICATLNAPGKLSDCTLGEVHEPAPSASTVTVTSADTPADVSRPAASVQATDPFSTRSAACQSKQDLINHQPLAVLADIHANLPALRAVLEWLEQNDVAQGVVLGDLVGYGPDAREVVELMRACNFHIIKGNHDHCIALGAYERGLSKHARHVAEWTHAQLSEEQLGWLKALPPVLDNDDWMAVHGAPLDPEFFYGYVYEMTYRENLDKLTALNRRLCFHGHSHMPGLYGRDLEGQDRHRVGEVISLESFAQCLVCPGSIGQSRNGTPHAQFAVYDPVKNEVSFKSLPYDYEPVVERMKAEAFPAELYRRLAKGV